MSIGDVAKTANTLIDTLRNQPSTIALIIVCFGLLTYIFYQGTAFNKLRSTQTEMIFDNQKSTQEILAKCIIPDQRYVWPPSLIVSPENK